VVVTTVRIFQCCGFRRTGKAMGHVYRCWWRIRRGILVVLSRRYLLSRLIMRGAIATPPYVFLACCLINRNDKFTQSDKIMALFNGSKTVLIHWETLRTLFLFCPCATDVSCHTPMWLDTAPFPHISCANWARHRILVYTNESATSKLGQAAS
jgi:hypothetical protein